MDVKTQRTKVTMVFLNDFYLLPHKNVTLISTLPFFFLKSDDENRNTFRDKNQEIIKKCRTTKCRPEIIIEVLFIIVNNVVMLLLTKER